MFWALSPSEAKGNEWRAGEQRTARALASGKYGNNHLCDLNGRNLKMRKCLRTAHGWHRSRAHVLGQISHIYLDGTDKMVALPSDDAIGLGRLLLGFLCIAIIAHSRTMVVGCSCIASISHPQSIGSVRRYIRRPSSIFSTNRFASRLPDRSPIDGDKCLHQAAVKTWERRHRQWYGDGSQQKYMAMRARYIESKSNLDTTNSQRAKLIKMK